MPAGGLLISAGIGLGTAIWGGIKAKKARQAQEALAANRPKYAINPEEYDIQNLAESRANQGMGAGARQQLQNNADRQLATLSSAALRGGADANAIGNLVDKSANAYSQNSIYDDQVRLQNLGNLQQTWARMSANKDKQWDLNTNQPWRDQMSQAGQNVQSANNLMMQGISGLTSSLPGIGKSLFSGGGGSAGGGSQGGDMGGGGEMRNSGGGGGGYGGDNSWMPSGPQGGLGDNSWMPQGPQSFQGGYSPYTGGEGNGNPMNSYWGGS